MSKFKKRIAKIQKLSPKDALVIGTGFGYLDEILEMYDTVFIYSKSTVNAKARNLVIKKELKSTLGLNDVTTIFIDLEYMKALDYIAALLQKPSPEIIIEGNDIIPRSQTTNLYRYHYNALAQGGMFHYWYRVK